MRRQSTRQRALGLRAGAVVRCVRGTFHARDHVNAASMYRSASVTARCRAARAETRRAYRTHATRVIIVIAVACRTHQFLVRLAPLEVVHRQCLARRFGFWPRVVS